MRVLFDLPADRSISYGRDQFLELINDLKPLNSTSLSLLPWRDWDHFTELADEDGGVDQEAMSFWNSFPVGVHLSDHALLKQWVERCFQHPVIQTRNDTHRIQYDIHIWAGPIQLAYNPELQLLIKTRHSALGRLTKPPIRTPWSQ